MDKQERINELLDKISESGFDSLSEQEKAELKNPEDNVTHMDMYEKQVEPELVNLKQTYNDIQQQGKDVMRYMFDLLGNPKFLYKKSEQNESGVLQEARVVIYEKNHHHVANLFYQSEGETDVILEVSKGLYDKITQRYEQPNYIAIKSALRIWCAIAPSADVELVVVESLS